MDSADQAPTDQADQATAGPASLTGIEQLRLVLASEEGVGISVLLGMDCDVLEEGRAVFSLLPGRQHTNPVGMVHGGIAATLLDSVMGCAVHTTLPAGLSFTTLDLNVHYTRGVRPGSGRLRAEGTVVHRGNRVATAEGRVTDEQGRLVAHATTTCMILAAPAA